MNNSELELKIALVNTPFLNLPVNVTMELSCLNNATFIVWLGARGGAVVETLPYRTEGRGIDSRLCHWNFSLA
jgi:hypothetical protein